MSASLAFAMTVLAGATGARSQAAAPPAASSEARFEKQVALYEAADRTSPPPRGAILLAGDSQFFRWKTLHEDLPGYTIVNRGIDSFQTSDLVRYADRLIVPYRPRLVVLHVGGNDVHNGKSAADVLGDFKSLVAKVRAAQPGVPIAFSSITPGPGRFDEAEQRKAANAMVKAYIATQAGLHYIDLWDAMLTADGKPREDLWVEDRIHPNHAGYLVRARIMRSLLGSPDRPALSSTITLPNVAMRASETINLWPGPAPGEPEAALPERIVPARPRPFDQITDVSGPTLSVFRPPPGKENGTGILLIPGGGFERLAIEHEGYEAAEWLIGNGITTFLLKYRVPARDPAEPWKAGLQDAQRAMGLIRANAAKWGVDTDSIGALGFSAGAGIDVLLSVLHAEPRRYAPVDDADSFSSRPDFNISMYGGGFTEPRTNALLADVANRLGAGTPPMFVVHAFDDAAQNSLVLMTALKRANVASELHVFGAGAHGFGVRETGLPVDEWRRLCVRWMRWQGFLDDRRARRYAREFILAREKGDAPLPRFASPSTSGTRQAAYASQRRVVRDALIRGDEVAGYTGVCSTVEVANTRSADGRIHGVLFKAGRIDGATSSSPSLETTRPVSIEPAIGYVIATDIATKVRVPRQAFTAVASLVPVVELPSALSTLMGRSVSADDRVAANLGVGRFVVGAPVSPETLDGADPIRVSVARDGVRSSGGGVTTTRASASADLMTLINQIVDQGRVIHAGDLLTCAVSASSSEAGRKGRYVATFGTLGTIAFELR